MMNGTISVESEKGVGTEFAVTVTLRNSDQKSDNQTGGIDPQAFHVLVVDDDKIAAEHARMVLDEVGIRADTCSSGEEAYTTAMHISEYLGAEKKDWDTRILATDISLKILSSAQEGIYAASGMQDLPDAWKTKYFDKCEDDKYKVKKALRDEVIFRTFNLMEDIPFTKAPFDLIFCRNVMIYFDLPTKTALVNRFYDVLKPGGYLYIGHAESISRNETKFEYIKPAVYRKPR
jgi:chemotaxis methyl-accepting protein methylase